MIKTKLFDNRGEQMIDTMINDFLEKGNRKLIDIKLTNVEENQFTQCEYIAVLIYEEGDTNKETIKVLGDATKELMNENKRYREALESIKNKLDTVHFREYQTVDFRHGLFNEARQALEKEE